MSNNNPTSGKVKNTRSRNGCKECKKKKKKCDELKPVCSYCKKKGIDEQCGYNPVFKLKTDKQQKKAKLKDIFEKTQMADPLTMILPEDENQSELPNNIKLSQPANFQIPDIFRANGSNEDETLNVNTDVLISQNILMPEITSPFNLSLPTSIVSPFNIPLQAGITSPFSMYFPKSNISTSFGLIHTDDHLPLDEAEENKVIEIDASNCAKNPEYTLTQNTRLFAANSEFSMMPQPMPIISQSIAYQSFLPFNISFKNQKILNFYETFTSSFMTPGFDIHEKTLSPFKQFIPKFVNKDKDLMKLVLLFAKIHMNQLGIEYSEDYINHDTDTQDDRGSFSSGMTTDNRNSVNGSLITLSDISFLDKIASQKASDNGKDELGTYTLKQMVLVSLHTFFPGASNINWRSCMKNAKQGIRYTSKQNEMFDFLNNWLCYQELMSSLTTSNLDFIMSNNFDYEFDNDENKSFENKDLNSNTLHIDEFSGMDRPILKYLNKTVKLLQKYNSKAGDDKLKVQIEAMELIIDMEKFMTISELLRDQLNNQAALLRTTNKIFGYITLYMLKRRILNIQIFDSQKLRESLTEIVDLIEQLPLNSAYSSCVFFAMFISGCDLIIYDNLIEKRQIILRHLESLHKNIGMESCQRVINYMLQCWLTKKSWWDVFIDNDIDIIFTI
ncbi:hypothetical protein QEN19_003609 [Hanseniaspora menglaensis]